MEYETVWETDELIGLAKPGSSVISVIHKENALKLMGIKNDRSREENTKTDSE